MQDVRICWRCRGLPQLQVNIIFPILNPDNNALPRFGGCEDNWEFAGINCEGTENSILDCVVGKPTDACNKGSEGAGVRCII